MKGGSPLVSVVMPVYNAAAWVASAIESILTQTYPNLEVILVDDGSDDDSPAILRHFNRKDARVKVLFVDHGGTTHAANHAIAHSQGKFIARLDNDDLAHPKRIACQVAWMKENDIQVCGTQVEEFGERSRLLWHPEQHDAIGRELLFRVPMINSSIMIEADILQRHLYSSGVLLDDYELLTRLHTRYRTGNVPHRLTYRRIHSNQQSSLYQNRGVKEVRKYRFYHFYRQYPKTSLTKYMPLAHLAEGKVFADGASLTVAADWLVRFAAHPDIQLRKQMADRWYHAYTAAQLAGTRDLPDYRRYLDAILPPSTGKDNEARINI